MAQSLVGTSLSANATGVSRNIAYKFEVNWGNTWDSLGSWVDESNNVESLSGEMRLSGFGAGLSKTGAAVSNRVTATLRNTDNRYSACKRYLVPVRAQMGFYNGATPELLNQFGGVIVDPKEQTIAKKVSFTCADRAAVFAEEKTRTAMYTDQAVEDWLAVLATEADIPAGDQIFDEGMFNLPFCWLDDEMLTSEMQAVAEADGGNLYFNKSGSLIYENMYHWLVDEDALTTASTFDFTIKSFQELEPEQTHKETYTSAIIEHQARDRGSVTVVYSKDDVIYVGPGAAASIKARLTKPAVTVYDAIEDTDYISLTAGGMRTSGSITVVGVAYAQQVDLEFTNSNPSYAIYIHDFQLRGDPLYGGPVNEEKYTSTCISGVKEFEIRGNPYIQSKGQAEALGTFYRDRLMESRQIYHLRGARGIPWLELGDKVSLTESDSAITTCAYIIGMTWQFKPGGAYTMDLDMLAACSLYPIAASEYFVINSSELGTSTCALFY